MGNNSPTLQIPAFTQTAGMDDETFDIDSYEMALMALLANLEYLRHRMEVEGAQKSQPEKAIARASQIVEQLSTFASEQGFPQTSLVIREATAHSEHFFAALTPVQNLGETPETGGGFRKWFGLGRKVANTEGHREPASRCLESLNEATTNYFIAFTERFGNSKLARPWVETASGFLADLKRVGRDMQG